MAASSIRERAIEELRLFVVLSIYLWICFGALLFYQSAILHAEGIAFLPLGFAALKAVVSAKFLMLGNFLPIAKRRCRPAARHAEPVDTSTTHVGFRCVVRGQVRS
jgi:hypothetical protein